MKNEKKKGKKKLVAAGIGAHVARKLDKSELMHLIVFEDQEPGGIVVGLSPTIGYVDVKWDWPESAPSKEEAIVDLMSEKDALKEYTAIEKEFNKMTKDITTKMAAAGQAVREAHKLAEKLNLDDMSMLPCFGPLFEAMEDCGWSTSSLSC